MTCNDDMRLWGRTSWRSNRDRMFRLAEYAYFKRVDRASMVRVAQRILAKEGFEIRMEDLGLLIDGNPGDLRSLLKDLQACTKLSKSRMVQRETILRIKATSGGMSASMSSSPSMTHTQPNQGVLRTTPFECPTRTLGNALRGSLGTTNQS